MFIHFFENNCKLFKLNYDLVKIILVNISILFKYFK